MTPRPSALSCARYPLTKGVNRIAADAVHMVSGFSIILGMAGCRSSSTTLDVDDDPRLECPRPEELPALISEVAQITERSGAPVFNARPSPMYHDCQSLQKPGQGNAPAFRAVVHVLAEAGVETRRDDDFMPNRGYRVASLKELEGKRYPDLGLGPNEVKCLYLGSINGGMNDPSQLRASIEPCGALEKQLNSSGPFNVLRETEGARFDDYPPVARFHWNTGGAGNTHHQAVGVKCGSGWCVVGRGNLRLEPLPMGVDPRERIRGWHDRQRVAERPGGGWKVGPRATIIPYEQPAELDDAQGFEKQGGVLVAKMVIDEHSPEYETNFLLIPGDTTLVYLEHTASEPLESGWKAILRQQRGKKEEERKVNYHSHGTQPVPTARWYWNFRDEHAWTRCPRGCCEVTSARLEA